MGGKTAEEVLRMIKRDSPIEARTMEEARGGFEAFYLRFRSELDTLSEPVSIDGIPAFWISTANASKDQVVRENLPRFRVPGFERRLSACA